MGPGEGGPHSPLTVPSLRPPTLPLLSPSPVFPPCFLSFLLHFLLPFLNGGLGRAVMVLFPALPSWARQTTTKVQEKDAFQVPLSSEPKSVTHWLLPREGFSHSSRVADLLLCPPGVWNDDPGDDFRMPDGSTLPPGSSEETLFHYGMTCESGPQSPQGRWWGARIKEAVHTVS